MIQTTQSTRATRNAILPTSPATGPEDAEPDDPGLIISRPSCRLKRRTYANNIKLALLVLVFVVLWCSQGVQAAAATPATKFAPSSVWVESPAQTTPWIASLTKRQAANTCACKSEGGTKHDAAFIVKACFIPILVVFSGISAGLTLGYMSLDTTQLQVLSKTGNDKQRKAAQRVLPLRANGHLLLITLLIANMVFNETLPVIAESVMGGGIQAVIASTVLVIIFAEIIPQTVCSRFGLQIGAAMVPFVRVIIYIFFVVAWPVAKLLEFLLGAHEGIVYRRAELKELVAMHASAAGHGDLQTDTVTIVGATLDLQAKVVRDAMTPLSSVFSLPIDTKLDYPTLGRILKAGHSRIPVYEEVPVDGTAETGDGKSSDAKRMRRKIIGVLLTKQLILLDPEDAVPLRDIPMSSLPVVSEDLPLLQILNTFQEGRSHIAAVHRSPRKPSFPPRLETIHSRSSLDNTDLERGESAGDTETAEKTSDEGGFFHKIFRKRSHSSSSSTSTKGKNGVEGDDGPLDAAVRASKTSLNYDESSMGEPCGIITLEDVIEELIGEEILDETDADETHQPAMVHYVPPEAAGLVGDLGGPPPAPSTGLGRQPLLQSKQSSLGGIAGTVGRLGKGIVRSRSAPGKDREGSGAAPSGTFVGDGTPVTGTNPGTVSGALGWGANAFGGGRKRSASPGKKSSSNPASAPAGSRNGTPGATTPTIPHSKAFLGITPIVDEPQVMTPANENGPVSLLRKTTAETPGAMTPVTAPTTPILAATPGPPGATRGATATTIPLLSEAVLVERGRRKLVAQGANLANVSATDLRLAGAGLSVSRPHSRSATPKGIARGDTAVTGPATGAVSGGESEIPAASRTQSTSGQARQKGGAFKSPSAERPLPQQVRLGKTSGADAGKGNEAGPSS
ncbi:hypothetical protein JCM10908_006062 [Rhodotorula pacifica]|uniref:uncharacterized protein n=1 Tax=Rhodotorula pacifica TaxID=1495444 RepID=UPI00317C001C